MEQEATETHIVLLQIRTMTLIRLIHNITTITLRPIGDRYHSYYILNVDN